MIGLPRQRTVKITRGDQSAVNQQLPERDIGRKIHRTF
jgi:hypothetical protein